MVETIDSPTLGQMPPDWLDRKFYQENVEWQELEYENLYFLEWKKFWSKKKKQEICSTIYED